MVFGIEQMHFVPPAAFASTDARPIFQAVFDHVRWYAAIMFGINVKSHTLWQSPLHGIVQVLHILPVVTIAVYHTGNVYDFISPGKLFAHDQ
jgi:hypothetical protein